MAIELLKFYADWCGPCKQQTPILDELVDEHDDVSVTPIDIEADPQRVNAYSVSSVPTLVITADDEVITQLVGLQQKDDIEAAIEQAR